MTHPPTLTPPKQHYLILDGLRGVAALGVLLFHTFEVYAGGDHAKLIVNHGHLAVDFFFMLSGFVIAYAYDDRLRHMSLWEFAKRRLIRLQPLIIIGSAMGALTFYLQDSPNLFPNIHAVPLWQLLLIMLIGASLIPVGRAMDIRGWDEMHPLNGAAWSLFYEYIANIAYALVLRRVSKVVLWALTLTAAAVSVHWLLTCPLGDFGGGWTIDDPVQLRIGFTRLAFPFLAGILIARTRRLSVRGNTFWLAAGVLAILLAMPRVGAPQTLWHNGLYECGCVIIAFPLIILWGAGGRAAGRTAAVCRFLGNISYPLYLIQYPIIYCFMAWVNNSGRTALADSWHIAAGTAILCVAVAYVVMRFCDLPIRAWLRKKFLQG